MQLYNKILVGLIAGAALGITANLLEIEWLRDTIRTHLAETNSAVAQRILDRWHTNVRHFKKVMPKDFKRVLEAAEKARIEGIDVNEAIMAAAALEKE